MRRVLYFKVLCQSASPTCGIIWYHPFVHFLHEDCPSLPQSPPDRVEVVHYRFVVYPSADDVFLTILLSSDGQWVNGVWIQTPQPIAPERGLALGAWWRTSLECTEYYVANVRQLLLTRITFTRGKG